MAVDSEEVVIDEAASAATAVDSEEVVSDEAASAALEVVSGEVDNEVAVVRTETVIDLTQDELDVIFVDSGTFECFQWNSKVTR
jgi:hypothetical protein